MDPASDSAPGGPDLATVVEGMTGNEAFAFLVGWNGDVDWATIRPRLELPDGSRLTFDKRAGRHRSTWPTVECWSSTWAAGTGLGDSRPS